MYAAELARHIRAAGAVGGDHRLRRRAAARRRRRPARRLQRPVGDRPAGSRPPPAAHLCDVSPPGRRGARRERPDVFVAVDFPGLQLQARARAAPAGRAGRVLHQPAVVGVASGTHEDDEAAGGPCAGDFSVRGTHLPGCRRAGRVGRPSAARRDAGAAAEAGDCRGSRSEAAAIPSSRCCRAAAATRSRRFFPISSPPPRQIRRRLPAVQFVVARAPHVSDSPARAARSSSILRR